MRRCFVKKQFDKPTSHETDWLTEFYQKTNWQTVWQTDIPKGPLTYIPPVKKEKKTPKSKNYGLMELKKKTNPKWIFGWQKQCWFKKKTWPPCHPIKFHHPHWGSPTWAQLKRGLTRFSRHGALWNGDWWSEVAQLRGKYVQLFSVHDCLRGKTLHVLGLYHPSFRHLKMTMKTTAPSRNRPFYQVASQTPKTRVTHICTNYISKK